MQKQTQATLMWIGVVMIIVVFAVLVVENLAHTGVSPLPDASALTTGALLRDEPNMPTLRP